jgi:hypothetical protein
MELTKEYVDAVRKNLEMTKNMSDAVSLRIREVLTVILGCFGVTLESFGYAGTGDTRYTRYNDDGTILENFGAKDINISCYYSPAEYLPDDLIAPLDIRYLTMKNDDIVEEVRRNFPDEVSAGLLAEKNRLAAEFEKQRIKDAQKEAAKKKKEVLLSLTEEQREALGLNPRPRYKKDFT